ncbi:2,3-bisphosphoglycerate-independent phosphoglycerate mutase [Halostella sp. JP-L12]|uniref:2,3-bisphosphoglycerate-independent phosphoglycerate mutase n=1 Tax=Halostella TaxID=1843185 RepID=UPI000EF75B55|nr:MULTISPECIES: 2,3-bisphosphoglycerate-independent phosphoglycerate mutase [Halostella]NHN46987.1 2,3-bisphosphoglycerate-independent phosphoglycerate mutase [Halostella sp. JP-L12]
MDAAIIILDGWGLGEHDRRDAVKAADTPNFDRYAESGAYGTLNVTGRRVGLPDGQMGNSEVGHLNIGAGRVVKQEYTRITDSIEEGTFHTNDALQSASTYAEEHDGRVHFMGLVSDGGVHSDYEHLFALVEMAAERGVEAVTHAFMDGRDTSPTAGAGYLRELEEVIEEHGTGHVATVTGRYYAMDRDQNWNRTKRAYDAIVNREADHESASSIAAVEESYDRGDTDEFVEPTLVRGRPALEDGDAVVFFNYRSDRARQLTRMLADIDPVWEFDTSPPDVEVVTMTQYDKTFDLPVAYPPHQPEDTLGEVLADHGRTQLRIAESEKYPHVTYFLNGGREVEFDGEVREIVESPPVATYDMQPEMSAEGVTDNAIRLIDADDPDLLVLNYANPDMVGHTGNYRAAITAVEAVDEQLGRLVDHLRKRGAHVLITADHGNADDMGTEADPHTAHTYNAVPLVYLDPEGTDGGRRVREGGTLADIAPTVLSLIGVERPAAMTGENLLE